MRGVRGAITVELDVPIFIREATTLLIEEVLVKNNIIVEDIASILFTVTSDIKSEFPAVAVREMGLKYVPLLNFQEMEKENSLQRCIRILVHWNTQKTQDQIQHIYLREAKKLRPDLLLGE